MIDLHVHSTFSDGSFTPEEVVDKAVKAKLTAVALTDHDCTDGLPRFFSACEKTEIKGIAGVEISAEITKGTMHMLGYYLDPLNPGLQDVLVKIREGRDIRNKEILEMLNGLGMDLTWEEIASYAGEDVVGRPHIARAMMAKGYVKTFREAFDRYLGKGESAYADRFRLTPERSISVISEAGGVPVLSHPFTLGLDRKALRSFVGLLVDAGLGGIEVFYSEHSRKRIDEYLALAKEFSIVATGGSDFHGEINPKIQIGVGFGKLRIPDSIIEELERRLTSV